MTPDVIAKSGPGMLFLKNSSNAVKKQVLKVEIVYLDIIWFHYSGDPVSKKDEILFLTMAKVERIILSLVRYMS